MRVRLPLLALAACSGFVCAEPAEDLYSSWHPDRAHEAGAKKKAIRGRQYGTHSAHVRPIQVPCRYEFCKNPIDTIPARFLVEFKVELGTKGKSGTFIALIHTEWAPQGK
jgi:hypothetical protein